MHGCVYVHAASQCRCLAWAPDLVPAWPICCLLSQVQKELESLKLELSKAKNQISQADEAITGQQAELQKLAAIIQEADAERVRQRREYEQVGWCIPQQCVHNCT
jgi:hypothetical protein